MMVELSDKLSAITSSVSNSANIEISDSNPTQSDKERAITNPKLKKFWELSERDRAELTRLMGEDIPLEERNSGLGEILGWKDGKSIKSMNEDASRWRKVLRDASLL
jgi:hypothetical protein